MVMAYFDGEAVLTKSIIQKPDSIECTPGIGTGELLIETGKHILLIKALSNSNHNTDWNLEISLNGVGEDSLQNITITTDNKDYTNVGDLLDNPKVKGLSVSYDGKYAAVSISQRNNKKNGNENWIKIINIKNGDEVRTFRAESMRHFSWSPVNYDFAYLSSNGKATTLSIANILNGNVNPILKDIKNFGGFSWSPSGDYIIYNITEKPNKSDVLGFKKYDVPQSHIKGWDDKSYIYILNLPNGTTRRLTSGSNSTYLSAYSPDGKKIIYSENEVDLNERPFSKSIFYLLDIESMELDSLFESHFSSRVIWSEDSNKILVMGGPSCFSKIGNNLESNLIPNEYDTQAYLYSLKDKKVKPITLDFNPSIKSAYWKGDDIFFLTTDKSFIHLYKFNIEDNKFDIIDTGVEYIQSISYSKVNDIAIYSGSSSNAPTKVYQIDLNTGEYNLLLDADSKNYDKIILGEVKDWNFTSSKGKEIIGRVYYPPNFNQSKKYPVMVYYYGGTSPVTREFEGRYPKNIWAANGYVVYVLQPSGTVGFGQNFSAVHVNDWGKTTAQEVIEGTKIFLENHQFADPKRIGCIGASYGGFLTLNILTKTDMFTAAVSHAGISSITSYWGEGYWGYSYSAFATAFSFPWNRKDIYVEHSALYNADKIKTPLLLLHGSADTNVPPGESIQIYNALKLLGNDVELIEIADQNHHIMEYGKRKKWTKTIIAYFDKYLKNQPDWWNHLYND